MRNPDAVVVRGVIGLLGVALICEIALADRAAAPITTADVYTKSHSFVKAAYPSLSGRGLVFTVAADRWRGFDEPVRPLTSVGFSVGERDRHGSVLPVFSGHIEFAENGSLYTFLADPSSSLFNRPRLEILGQLIASHRDWTQQEIAKAAADAGAQFGPDRREDMEREVDGWLRGIERILGQIRRGPLHFRTDDRTPRWVFDVTVASEAGDYTYTAIAEPFDRRLMSLSRANR